MKGGDSSMKRHRISVIISLIFFYLFVCLPAMAVSQLDRAFALAREGSWQMARDAYNEVAASTTSTVAEKRAATYYSAWTWIEQKPHDPHFELNDVLKKLIDENSTDDISALAAWRLAQIKSRQINSDADLLENVSEWKAAEKGLEAKQPNALKDYYISVLHSRTFSGWIDKKKTDGRGEFKLDILKRYIACEKDNSVIADLNRMKIDLDLTMGNIDEIEATRQIGGLADEFPGTEAGAGALMYLANMAMNTFSHEPDYVAALKHLDRIQKEFPKTKVCKNVAALKAEILRPVASYSIDRALFPGETYELNVRWKNVKSLSLQLIPFDLPGVVMNDKSFDLKKITGTPEWETTLDGKDVFPLHQETSKTITLKPEHIGAYLVLAKDKSNGQVLARALLNVTSLIAVHGELSGRIARNSSTSNNKLSSNQVWVVDGRSGEPCAGATLLVLLTGRDDMGKETHDVNVGLTNAVGLADVTPLIKGNKRYRIIATKDKSVALLGFSYSQAWWEDPHEQQKALVFTDRPVYKPGDHVNLKTFMHTRKDGLYQVPFVKQNYKLEVKDSKYNTIVDEPNVNLTEYGTYNTSFTLSQDSALGEYDVIVNGDNIGHFSVEEYRKPEFEVTVKMPVTDIKPGTTVTVDINGKYYWGAPVKNAEVKYTVRRQRHWFPFFRYRDQNEYTWFDATNEGTQFKRHNNGGKIIEDGLGKTDADGNFKVEFLAELEQESNHSNYFWGFRPHFRADDFTVEATIVDSSRRNIDGVGRITVGDRSMVVNVQSERHLASPGDVVCGSVTVENLSGKQVVTSGTLYVEKVEWKDKDTTKETITTLTQFALTTLENGKAPFKWTAPKDEQGYYRFLYVCQDSFGATVMDNAYCIVVDKDASELLIKHQGLTIESDKDTYDVGDIAKLLISNEITSTTAWWYLSCENAILDSRMQALPEQATVVELLITENMVPNCRLDLIVVKDGNVYSTSKRLIVPPLRKILNVDIKTDKNIYAPGEKGHIAVNVKDSAGHPVKGEFLIAVYDKALEYINPNQTDDIRHAYYGECHAPSVRFDWSATQERTVRDSDAVPALGGNTFSRKAVTRDENVYKETLALAMDASNAPVSEAELSVNTAVTVRSDFSDTALWIPTIYTDDHGNATAEVTWPDSLTTWKVLCAGITKDVKVGQVTTETVTNKSLKVRLSLPPFLREKDETTVSVIVANDSNESVKALVYLNAENVTLNGTTQTVALDPAMDKRIDWAVVADRNTGSAKFTAVAKAEKYSDAMITDISVLPYGSNKFESCSGALVLGPTSTAVETLISIPEARIPSATKVNVRLQPSLAMILHDSLPSLIDYPYGCVEQTMNRFVPAAVAAHAFDILGLKTNADLSVKLPDIIRTGNTRLLDMQTPSGGWGWWKDSEPSVYMTAVVMDGLTIARASDLAIDENMFKSGLNYLQSKVEKVANEPFEPEENKIAELCYALYVLSNNNKKVNEKAYHYCYGQRSVLSPGGLAMLAMVAHRLDKKDDMDVCFRNLQNFAVKTPENSSIHWGAEYGRGWYNWWDDPVESTARALNAYLEVYPDSENAAGAMKWLVMNRRGCDWRNTKATGMAVLALTNWMIKKQENTKSDMDITVTFDGKTIAKKHIDADNFWDFDGNILIDAAQIRAGNIPVKIEAKGTGTLFWLVSDEYYTKEDHIKKTGYEVYVERSYEKRSTRNTDGKIEEQYTPLKEGETLKSGDEVRCRMKIKALNNFSYIVLEDYKPACLVPVDVSSGMKWGEGLCSNTELRQTHTSFFIEGLQQGEHTLNYNLRAEAPGVFHAMPAIIFAMYVDEVKGNSDSEVVTVEDSVTKD